jgi:hypothetical protein
MRLHQSANKLCVRDDEKQHKTTKTRETQTAYLIAAWAQSGIGAARNTIQHKCTSALDNPSGRCPFLAAQIHQSIGVQARQHLHKLGTSLTLARGIQHRIQNKPCTYSKS